MKFKIIETLLFSNSKVQKTYNIYERHFFGWYEAYIPNINSINGLSKINFFTLQDAEAALFKLVNRDGYFRKCNTVYTFIKTT